MTAKRNHILSTFYLTFLVMPIAGCLPGIQATSDTLSNLIRPTGVTGNPKTPKSRFLVVSAATHTGDFLNDIGLTGSTWEQKADSFCNSSLPGAVNGTGVYRALMTASTGRTGTSSGQVNWPLLAGVQYFDADGSTLIGNASSANLFDIPVTNNFVSGGNYWTGTNNASSWSTGNDCGAWSNTAVSGDYGIGTYSNASLFYQGSALCSTPKNILCAQDARDEGNGTVSSVLQNLTWMKCNFGETWDPGTGLCTGSYAIHKFCTLQDDHCNGGTDTGALTGIDSQIYDDCAAQTLGGRSWRVPTVAELQALYLIFQQQPSMFPTTLPQYYWSNSGYPGIPNYALCVNFSTGGTAVSTKDNSSFSTILRCVSDGL